MQNFSFLAGLEVTEKFVWGGGDGFQVATVSNLNEVALTWVELHVVFFIRKCKFGLSLRLS